MVLRDTFILNMLSLIPRKCIFRINLIILFNTNDSEFSFADISINQKFDFVPITSKHILHPRFPK